MSDWLNEWIRENYIFFQGNRIGGFRTQGQPRRGILDVGGQGLGGEYEFWLYFLLSAQPVEMANCEIGTLDSLPYILLDKIAVESMI